MADANTEVDLQALHEAIRSQIAAAFPSFKTVEFYRDDEDEKMPTPACLLHMTEAEPAPEQDAGTGQWPALLRFEAHIIMAHRSDVTPIEIRKAATAVATWLHLRRWGPATPTDPCAVIACEPDEFAPNLDKFKVWRVEWVNMAMLGVSAWHNDGTIPDDALYSWSPEIGIGHEDDYQYATDGPTP
ncbi:MAG TPA: hypothetical protein VJM50_23845 [Pyrinomonadaceae bacterium]|nr:hypothetical protein [Pyrinomonadaceae bacterium]